MTHSVQEVFERLGGVMIDGFPIIDSEVFRTENGTLYLKKPAVVMIAKPAVNTAGLGGFLGGFDTEVQFLDYLSDPVSLPEGTQLVKVAGQTCYLSFGPKRTWNKDAQKYIMNLISSGHGSVLEHPCWSFLVYGMSRSETHEQVRHRAGWAYSQVSQRYVSGDRLRFVERPEYQNDEWLHQQFEKRIDGAAREYEEVTQYLIDKQSAGDPMVFAESRTDRRKKVQQCSRSVLPNETEAPMVLTANARAWRHVIEMRTDQHAEIEIREVVFRAFLCLALLEPILFGDYTIEQLGDGTFTATTPYRKV